MNIGARIIKTGLSVTLALFVASFFNMQPAALSAVAAVLAIQPSVMRSWRYLKEVIITNVIGVIFASLGFYLFGSEPFFIGLIVVLTIAVNLKLGLTKTINLSVLSVIAILTTEITDTTSTFYAALDRFSMVGIGVVSSILINVLVIPPKHEKRFYDSMRKLNDKLNILLRLVPQKEITITTFKKEKENLDKIYNKTNDLFELLNEEKIRLWVKDRQLFLRKIVVFRQMQRVFRTEISLFEKIEKHFNTMSFISTKETEEVKDTVNEMLQYQENIFLIYEGKIPPKTKEQSNEKTERIETKLKCTVNDLMKHYDPANEELWWRLFSIVNGLIETIAELERLERMVSNVKQRDIKRKKNINLREEIKKIEEL